MSAIKYKDIYAIDPARLIYFTEVADQGSFSKAADTLRISQPAISKTVKLLEEQLNVLLLNRSREGVTLTLHGSVLYTHAKTILSEMTYAVGKIKHLRNDELRRIRFGTLPSLVTAIVAPAVADWSKEHADWRVEFFEDYQPDLLPPLKQGEYDFIIARAIDSDPEPGLRQRVIFRDEACIIARAEHPLAGMAELDLLELTRFPWVGPIAGYPHRPFIDRVFQAAGVRLEPSRIACKSVDGLSAIVKASDSLALVPSHAVASDLASKRLARLPVKSDMLSRNLVFAYLEHRPLSPEAKALIAHIEQAGKAIRNESLP